MCELQVFHQDVLASLLAPESAQYAVRTALEIFTAYRNQTGFPVLPEMFEDHLGLSEGLTGSCSCYGQLFSTTSTWSFYCLNVNTHCQGLRKVN